MNKNMRQWRESILDSPHTRAMPVLSYPVISLEGISLPELISDSDILADSLVLLSQRIDSCASVSMMDLSAEAECFGAKVNFSQTDIPTVEGAVITDLSSVDGLEVPQAGACRTGIYLEAAAKASSRIDKKPVFGGVIGPFSLAGRLMGVSELMMACYDEPENVHKLIAKTAAFIRSYILAFREAGANGVIIAEPLAGVVSPDCADEFSSAAIRKIVGEMQEDGFMLIYHNCGGNTPKLLPSMLSTGCKAFSVGNQVDLGDILPYVPADTLVLGNLNPVALKNAQEQEVRDLTLGLLNRFGSYRNYVISTGCDTPPDAVWRNIDAFFDTVKQYTANQRRT